MNIDGIEYPSQTKEGYWFRYITINSKCGRIFAHREIYSKNYKIPEKWEIHHIDEDNQNNSIDNLVAMSKENHTSLHRKGKKASKETRTKSSESHKGYKHTEEAKRNMSIAQTGMKHSRSYLITIQNTKTGETDTGCCNELARKHGFHQGHMCVRGKANGWIRIK